MSWGPNSFTLRRAALAALLAAGATAAAANVLVVRSSGPSAASYKAGRSLPDNARITLRQGDTVVVLTGGGTRTFRGPGTFSPSSAVRAGPRVATDADGRRPGSGRCAMPACCRAAARLGRRRDPERHLLRGRLAPGPCRGGPDASLRSRLRSPAQGGAGRTVQWARASRPSPGHRAHRSPGAPPTASGRRAWRCRCRSLSAPSQGNRDLERVAAALIEMAARASSTCDRTQPEAGS